MSLLYYSLFSLKSKQYILFQEADNGSGFCIPDLSTEHINKANQGVHIGQHNVYGNHQHNMYTYACTLYM